MIITAKFRCMSRKDTWDGSRITEFYPVIPRRVCGRIEEDGSEENERFWKASPSGELSMHHHGVPPFEAGAYYYVHMERIAEPDPGERLWELSSFEKSVSSLGVVFSLPWSRDHEMRDASMKLQIDNADAWPAFYGREGTRWRFVFEPAKK